MLSPYNNRGIFDFVLLIMAGSVEVASTAFSGAQYLMGLQIFVKLITFSMNAIVIYLAGEEAFGVASVRFELLLSTILFLSREGMRNTTLRMNNKGGRAGAQSMPTPGEQRLINAALVPILAGIGMASSLYLYCVGWERQYGDDRHYYLSLTIYIIAACIELLVEPLFILSRERVLFRLQAKCEGVAVSGRCLAVVFCLLLGIRWDNSFRLLAFAIGQTAYAVLILFSYMWAMSDELDFPIWHCYIPRPANQSDSGAGYLSKHTRKMAATFVGQSLLKHFLTQGDNMVMARFASPKEMGTFALISNYGSIPARVVFLPLEEASRVVFSQITATSPQSKKTAANTVRYVLTTLGQLQMLLGMVVVVFGALLSSTLLSLVGMTDTTKNQAFIAYCIYLPFMGLNGFMEAFMHSVAERRQLLRINIWMTGFTVAYVVLGIQLLHVMRWGSTGMVAANIFNMALRIAYCQRFITQWFSRRGYPQLTPKFSQMVPHLYVSGTCLTAAAIIIGTINSVDRYVSPDGLAGKIWIMATGSVMGLAVLASIWRFEQPFIRAMLDLRAERLATTTN